MQLVKQGNQSDYNYKEFFLDNISELDQILNSNKGKGACIAYIISTGDVYMLNSQMEWIKQ